MRVAPIIGHFHVEIDALRQCQTEAGIEHEQRRVTLIALGIEINWVGICHILVLITLPCEYTIVVSTKRHAANFAEFHQATCLNAVSATHIVVAVDYMIVVAKASAKQYAVNEDALLELSKIAHLGETADKARTYRSCLRDAIRHNVRTVLHGFVVLIVEVLEQSEHHISTIRDGYGHALQSSQKMNARDERLVST